MPSCRCAAPDADDLALGFPDGTCMLVDDRGSQRWLCRLDSPISALAFLDGQLLAGTASGTIVRFTDNGRIRWSYQCAFRPERDFWNWWFLATPYVGALAAGSDPADGARYVAAGTGSCALNILDGATGRLVADVISPYGLADLIQAHRGADETELRFFVAHQRLTCSSSVRAWSPQAETRGAQVYDALCGASDSRAPGWDMCGAADFHVGRLSPSRGEAVLVLRHGAFSQLAAYDMTSAEPLWMTALGGSPVGLAVPPSRTADVPCRIAVAERFGWVTVFSADGERVAARCVGERLLGIAATAPEQLFTWGPQHLSSWALDARPIRTSLDAEPLGWCRTSRRAGLLICDGAETRLVTLPPAGSRK